MTGDSRRLLLQKMLEDSLDIKNVYGVKEVYFQPPEGFKIKYPCVIYELASTFDRFANNESYFGKEAYRVRLVDRNPDSIFFQKLKKFRYSRFERHYVSDNLHNWIFNIYV